MSARRVARFAWLAATFALAVPAAAQKSPNTGPPTLGPVKQLVIPPVIERKLANGLRLLIVEQHELPLVDMFFEVRSGSEADQGKAGLASMVANMLDEGAGGRSALDIAEQMSFLGIGLTTGAGFDQTRISLHTPLTQLDSALALTADVVLRPGFPANEFERVRKERLTQLLQLRDRGPAIADAAYSFVLYGPEHPYGHPQVGDEPSVTSMTRGDIQSFYQSYYRPNNTTIIIVGDVQPDDVQRRIEKWFGSWQQGAVPTIRFPEPPASPGATIYLIDKPGAAQSSVRMGGIGVPRSTQDYYALVVMNTVLGGSFSSRLNQNLRETHGYTYGAFSNFDMRKVAGPFVASSEIVTEKSDSALVESVKEMKGISEPIPAEELERAKNYVQLGLPGEFETTGGIAARLIPIALYDLPLDYFNGYSRGIGGVTQADAARVAQRYVRPDALQIVVVGDLKQIEPSIRALGIGKIEHRDMSGRPVQP